MCWGGRGFAVIECVCRLVVRGWSGVAWRGGYAW